MGVFTFDDDDDDDQICKYISFFVSQPIFSMALQNFRNSKVCVVTKLDF